MQKKKKIGVNSIFLRKKGVFFVRFSATHFGESPMCEIIFHPIFWHNQKIYAKKKYFFCVNSIFLRKKGDFSDVFFCFLWPAFGHGRLGRSAWSIFTGMIFKVSPLIILKELLFFHPVAGNLQNVYPYFLQPAFCRGSQD